MAGGVFYREFTKFCGFTKWTALSVVHTHYFILGMMFFLVLDLVEKNIHFMDQKTNRAVIGYHAGLNITASMLFINGCCYLRDCRYWTSCIRCFYDYALISNQEKL